MNPRNSQIDLDHQAALDEDNNRHWHELAAYVEYGIKKWKGRYDVSPTNYGIGTRRQDVYAATGIWRKDDK